MRKYVFILYERYSNDGNAMVPVHGYSGTKLQFEMCGKYFLESRMRNRSSKVFEIRRTKICGDQEFCYDGNTEKTILIYKGGEYENKNKRHLRCYRRGNFLPWLILGCGLWVKPVSGRRVSKNSNNTAMSGEAN